jgi:hypothetical protein
MGSLMNHIYSIHSGTKKTSKIDSSNKGQFGPNVPRILYAGEDFVDIIYTKDPYLWGAGRRHADVW